MSGRPHFCAVCAQPYAALRRAELLRRVSEAHHMLKHAVAYVERAPTLPLTASAGHVEAAAAYLAELHALEVEHLCPTYKYERQPG